MDDRPVAEARRPLAARLVADHGHSQPPRPLYPVAPAIAVATREQQWVAATSNHRVAATKQHEAQHASLLPRGSGRQVNSGQLHNIGGTPNDWLITIGAPLWVTNTLK